MKDRDPDDPSVLYVFVRGRELEGTFPSNAGIGVWPITELRIMRGWGIPPDIAWPFHLASSWPPIEPSGIDALAKLERIGRYQRVLPSARFVVRFKKPSVTDNPRSRPTIAEDLTCTSVEPE